MRRVLLYGALAVVVLAGSLGWRHHTEMKAEDRQVRGLAIDQLHMDCEAMRKQIKDREDLAAKMHDPNAFLDVGSGLQVLAYEMNIRNAIDGTENDPAMKAFSNTLQGELTPETRIRVHADAAERLAKARKVYEESERLDRRDWWNF